MSDDTQVYEVFIRATPEKVWDAITNPQQSEQYFFGTRVSLEPKKGGRIAYTAGGHPLVDGEVLEVSAPERLVTTWRIHYDPTTKGEVSTVTWRCEPRGEATKLTLTHELKGAPRSAKSVGTDGWSVVLSGMKTLVETGEPLVLPQQG